MLDSGVYPLVPKASNRPEDGPWPQCSNATIPQLPVSTGGLPGVLGTSKRQPCGLFETLQSLPIYVGQRNLCTAGLQDPKGFIMALTSRNELRLLHFSFCVQALPVPSLSLINKGGASCYMQVLGPGGRMSSVTSNFPLFTLS